MSIIFILIIGVAPGNVEYKGDTLNYLWEEEIIWLLGNAEVKTPEIVASADTIKYEAKEDIVSATGNPILWIGSQKIEGEKMIYDLETGAGIVRNGRTQIRNGWFDGRVIRKVGTNILNIDYGKFTTCNLNPPHYHFWGSQLKVFIDDMVYVKPIVLFVQDIPLFIAPFWWFPIKSGRQSGLLHPKIGQSSDKGRFVENLAYYWVINGWSDATFILDYFETRGPRFNFEGRWVLSPTAYGIFNSSYIAEHAPLEQEKRKRWAVDFSHSQRFANRLSLRTEGKFISDDSVKVDYEEERLVQLDKIMNSYLSISKAWDWGGTNFVLEEKRDLRSGTIQRWLPKSTYSLNSMRSFGGYFSYGGSFTNSSMSEEYEQYSFNKASFSLPFKLFRYLSLAPATSHSYTLKWPEQHEKSHHSEYKVDLSTNIYGSSIFGPEFRHIMSPRLSYSLVDTIYKCSFSVDNNFQLVLGEKKISLARLDLSGSWDFELDRINPIGISLYSTPFRLLDLRSRWTYKPYEADKLKFERLILNSYFTRQDFSLNMSYSWIPREDWSDDQSLRFTLNTKLTKNWKLGFSGMFDFLDGELIDKRFSLHRDLHCWEAVFNFNSYAEEWYYDFKLQLKAIPEIKVGKTLFGIFL